MRTTCLPLALALAAALAGCGDDGDVVRVSPDVPGGTGEASGPVAVDGCVVAPGSLPARHRVVAGDTLRGIAVRYYGDAELWREITRANPELVGDGFRIRVGDVLEIPYEGR